MRFHWLHCKIILHNIQMCRALLSLITYSLNLLVCNKELHLIRMHFLGLILTGLAPYTSWEKYSDLIGG